MRGRELLSTLTACRLPVVNRVALDGHGCVPGAGLAVPAQLGNAGLVLLSRSPSCLPRGAAVPAHSGRFVRNCRSQHPWEGGTEALKEGKAHSRSCAALLTSLLWGFLPPRQCRPPAVPHAGFAILREQPLLLRRKFPVPD